MSDPTSTDQLQIWERCSCGVMMPMPGMVIEIIHQPEKGGDHKIFELGSCWLVLGWDNGLSSHWLTVTQDEIDVENPAIVRALPMTLNERVKGIRKHQLFMGYMGCKQKRVRVVGPYRAIYPDYPGAVDLEGAECGSVSN